MCVKKSIINCFRKLHFQSRHGFLVCIVTAAYVNSGFHTPFLYNMYNHLKKMEKIDTCLLYVSILWQCLVPKKRTTCPFTQFFPSIFFPTFQLSNMASVIKMSAPSSSSSSSSSSASSSELLSDPFFLAMESGKIKWGDLIHMSTSKIEAELTRKRGRIVEWWTEEYKIAERLEDWDVPDLTLRSDIEEHFPVSVLPLPASEDGRERFVVTFDARVDEWATTRAESHEEFIDYADWVHTRLVFALRQYSHKYRLESERGDDYVVIFSMAHPSAAARRGRAAIPTLRGFPVTWDRDPVDHTRHLVKIHYRRISDERVDPVRIAENLVDALFECKDCTFEAAPADSPYLLIVTIPTAEPPAVAAAAAPAPAVAAPAPAAAAAAPAHRPFVPVLLSHGLVWKFDELDRRIHKIERVARGHRVINAEQEAAILKDLANCTDCTVERCPGNRQFMFIVKKKI